MRNARNVSRIAVGMMAEIINHGNAAGHAANFHAAFDALEGVERGLNLLILQPAMFGAGDDRERIAHVQFAHQIRCEI